MLNDSIKRNITSISDAELEELFEDFVAENKNNDESAFITHLFHTKRITTVEFKNIQAQEKIELTSIANVSDIANFDIESLKGGEKEDDEYTILESLDKGAMGEILIARDNKLRRTVAYKRIHPHVAEIPSYLGRFYMEAQVTAQLQHPSIVPVYGLMVKDNVVGYAMKLIDGITLKALIQETMQQYDKHGYPDEHHTLHARLEHFLKVCDALHYAHRKGVIHRDLKPLNIMVGPYNEVYVMDWGIAKTIEVDKETFDDKTEQIGYDRSGGDSDKTVIGQVMGTPAYMSPEQAEGDIERLDHRSDLYSLGLILMELVTFYRGRNGKTVDELMIKARQGIIDTPPKYGKQADAQEQLLAIVNKATQYLPEDRYATVEEFADDIRRFMHGEAIHARPESIRQKVMRWITHHRIAAVNIMSYTILISFIFLSVIFYQQVQSMKQSNLESERSSHFITNVSSNAQQIDAELLRYEAILEGLTTGARTLLNQGTPDPSRYYTDLTIALPGEEPPDYAFSEVYGFPISIGWHVYKLAPGVDEKQVEPLLRKLNPLRHTFKPLMLKSHNTPVPANDTDAAREIIMNEGLPLVWMYVGLEEGFIAEYPGKTGYPTAYDPRQRPWYRGTIGKTGSNWLQPYIDVGGRGVLLPCTNPLYDENGKFMGVAGVEITLEYVRKELMPMKNVPGIEETFLLNDKGEIITASSDKAQSYGLGTLINSIEDMDLYPNKEVVKKILQGKSGQTTYVDKGRTKMLAFYKLNSIGWYFLAAADEKELMAEP